MGLQIVFAGRLGQGQPARAAPEVGGVRQVDLLAHHCGVLLVGEKMAGQALGRLDYRTDQAGPTQRALQAMPVHGATAEDFGQGPGRDYELAK